MIIINKSTFLSELREAVEKESNETLKMLFIQAANYYSADVYESVLRLFKRYEGTILLEEDYNLIDKATTLCERVADGEYDIDWGYPNFSDYWSDEETLFDKDGLGKEIQDLLERTISYVMGRKYEEAYKVFNMLFDLSIPTEESDNIEVTTLFDNDLINLDLTDVSLYYAYSAIMCLCGIERCKKLYNIMGISSFNINLFNIAAIPGDEIPDEEDFKEEWINFLLKQDLKYYERILIDAVKFSGGAEALEDFVNKYGEKYQSSYSELISTYKLCKKYDFAIKVAEDGLNKLKGENLNRAKIADLLCNIGKEIDDPDKIRKGLIEGFKSSFDLEHFMGLYELRDKNILKEMVQYMDEKQIKPLYEHDDSYIHFLNGDYELIYDKCKKDNKYLGWSISEKGDMIPLFTALLAKDSIVNPCSANFIKVNFPVKYKFDDFIRILPSSFLEMPKAIHKKYMDYCFSECEKRVEAIVGGKHRRSYNKASAFVVSLAEVIRSNESELNAEDYIRSYKIKYPRHSAFHGCLREDITLAKFKVKI